MHEMFTAIAEAAHENGEDKGFNVVTVGDGPLNTKSL